MRIGADQAGPGRGYRYLCGTAGADSNMEARKYIFHFKKKEEKSSPDLESGSPDLHSCDHHV